MVSSIEEATKAQTTLKLKAVCVLVELSQAARLRIRLTHSPHIFQLHVSSIIFLDASPPTGPILKNNEGACKAGKFQEIPPISLLSPKPHT